MVVQAKKAAKEAAKESKKKSKKNKGKPDEDGFTENPLAEGGDSYDTEDVVPKGAVRTSSACPH